jgi:PAS domain S-box-containing protein
MTFYASIPQGRADRRQLQQIIAGLAEGVILIDPDGSIVWANDAALAMHGVKELHELGADAEGYRARFVLRYRNHHLLEAGQYPIERLIAGEVVDGVVVGVSPTGQEETQWVHEARTLVLTTPTNTPDCLVLVLEDATRRVDAEQRFERAFNANPAPAVICRLADKRFVKVNAGFLDMTGFTSADVIDKSVYELDVLDAAERRDLAIQRLNAGQTIPQMEATLKVADGKRKCVIVAGQPIDVGGASCMLFTFIDLEPRKRAEDDLRRSEERFVKFFRLTPAPTFIHEVRGGSILDANNAFLQLSGYSADEVLGHSLLELGLWHLPAQLRAFQRAMEANDTIRDLDMRLHTKDGIVLDCSLSAGRLAVQGKDCVLGVLEDVTERKRTEEELVAAIETVMKDTSWFSHTVIEKLAALRQPARPTQASAELSELTGRERQTLELVCEGLADKEIAHRLGLSNSTVRNCVSSLYRKIGVRRRSAAVVWARQRGITGANGH